MFGVIIKLQFLSFLLGLRRTNNFCPCRGIKRVAVVYIMRRMAQIRRLTVEDGSACN